MAAIKLILLLLFSLLIVIFAVENFDMVELSFFDFQFNLHHIKVPLIVVILCSLATGFLLCWLGGIFPRMKLNAVIRKQDKVIEDMKSELERLKPPPAPLPPVPPPPPQN